MDWRWDKTDEELEEFGKYVEKMQASEYDKYDDFQRLVIMENREWMLASSLLDPIVLTTISLKALWKINSAGRDEKYMKGRILSLSLRGETGALKALLENHGMLPHIDHQDDSGYSGLMMASIAGHADTVAYLLSASASPELLSVEGISALGMAVVLDCLSVCLVFVGTATFFSEGMLESYGSQAIEDVESAATIAHRRAFLRKSWANGPHKSQRWERRKHFLCFLAENGYRPLAERHAVLAVIADILAAIAPLAPIPSVSINTPDKKRLHILSQVFSNEALVREIAGFLPAK